MKKKQKLTTTTAKEQPPSLGIEVRKSKIDGKGCFAARAFRKGQRIAEYEGERISRAEIKRRVTGAKRIHICAIDSYWAIDGSVGGNGTQYINHSCNPNGFTKTMNRRVYFYALRDIKAGEEIVLDYIASWHDDETKCSCGAKNCRGTINLLEK